LFVGYPFFVRCSAPFPVFTWRNSGAGGGWCLTALGAVASEAPGYQGRCPPPQKPTAFNKTEARLRPSYGGCERPRPSRDAGQEVGRARRRQLAGGWVVAQHAHLEGTAEKEFKGVEEVRGET
jgi:hypothetical protein